MKQGRPWPGDSSVQQSTKLGGGAVAGRGEVINATAEGRSVGLCFCLECRIGILRTAGDICMDIGMGTLIQFPKSNSPMLSSLFSAQFRTPPLWPRLLGFTRSIQLHTINRNQTGSQPPKNMQKMSWDGGGFSSHPQWPINGSRESILRWPSYLERRTGRPGDLHHQGLPSTPRRVW